MRLHQKLPEHDFTDHFINAPPSLTSYHPLRHLNTSQNDPPPFSPLSHTEDTVNLHSDSLSLLLLARSSWLLGVGVVSIDYD